MSLADRLTKASSGSAMPRALIRFIRRLPWSALLVLSAVGLMERAGHFERLEWSSLDLRTSLRAKWFQTPPSGRVMLIGFGDHSRNILGEWPVPRSYHALLQNLMMFQPPKVLVWDVIFPERLTAGHEKLDPDSDADFAATTDALSNLGTKVVFSAVSNADPTIDDVPNTGATAPISHVEGDIARIVGDPHAVLPFPELRRRGLVGFVDAPRAGDGVVRDIPLIVRAGDHVYPSLGLQGLLGYWGVSADQVRVVLGDSVYIPAADRKRRIPISETGTYAVNYRFGEQRTEEDIGSHFTTLEYFNVLAWLKQFFVDEDRSSAVPWDLTDQIVMVGEFSTDTGPTPLGPYSPLVLVHANVIQNILDRDFVSRVPTSWVWSGLVLLSALSVGLSRRVSAFWLLTFTVTVVVLYSGYALQAWVFTSQWVPFVAPVAGFLVLQFVLILQRVLFEQNSKETIRGMFNSYLSPELLAKMLSNPQLAGVSGERKPVTILFSDLRGFTSWSERTPEDQLIPQLNEYLAAMVACIHAEGGTLHKFIGDAVMAVWGDLAPKSPAEDAAAAARAALAMQVKLEVLNRRWASEGRDALRMGIGLNHGKVIVGNVGSPQRMEFTVIGDAVNLASRFESMTKELGVDILVGSSVAELLSNRFPLRPKGEVPIKGKRDPIPVYELCRDVEPRQETNVPDRLMGLSAE